MKKIFLIYTVAVFLLSTGNLFAFERVPTATLLNAYLENNSDLKKLTISERKAELNLESTEINNGFDITLSTGTMTFRMNQDGSSFTVSPSVQASLPQVSNLTVSASSDIYIGNAKSESVEDANINLSVDIISANSLSRKIQLMKAERNVEEAKRNLKNQILSAETQFYTELKALLSSTASIITAKTDYYSDKINFEQIKAKGYTATSSTYMLAEMKVISDEHEIDTKERNLIHDYVVFYKKCGYDIQIQAGEDMISYLPNDIPVVEALNIQDFDSEKYTEIESSIWTQKINELSRQADKNMTLAANGGYTFNNSSTKSDTVNAGLSSQIGGVNLKAGVSVPVAAAETSPAYTFGATVNPATFKKNKISQQEKELNIQQEELNIDEARNNYDTFVVDKQQSLNNILWEKKTYEENYEMYEKLARDFETYYEMGVVSESEYLTSMTNEKNYKVKLIMNRIDLITYNNNLKVKFVEN